MGNAKRRLAVSCQALCRANELCAIYPVLSTLDAGDKHFDGTGMASG